MQLNISPHQSLAILVAREELLRTKQILKIEGGEWKDMESDDFSWEEVVPEHRIVRAVGPSSERWNQEVAALAIARTLGSHDSSSN